MNRIRRIVYFIITGERCTCDQVDGDAGCYICSKSFRLSHYL